MKTSSESAGVLGMVIDLCTRKDWIQIDAARAYRENMVMGVFVKPNGIQRGQFRVLAVSKTMSRIYVDCIPVGTSIGDVLIPA